MNKKTIWDYAFMCHKKPGRSFFYKGNQFPICARCTGILLGYIIALPLIALCGILGVKVTILLMLPLIIDGGIQLKLKVESTNIRRLVTGILFGIAVINVILGYLYLNWYLAQKLTDFLLNQ